MTSPRGAVLVTGAGIAGLGAAVLLRRAGVECEVWEASPSVGGLLAPVDFLGVPCDRGSHRVHADARPELFALTRDAGWEAVPRRGVLVLGGRHVPYPLDPAAFARALGLRATASMALGWALRPGRLRRFRAWERDRAAGDDDEGFEGFVLARVGAVAYERFYRPYVEKVWGVDASLLSRTVARQRLSTASPWSSLLGSLRPASPGRAFLYPRRALAAVIEGLLRECERLGARVHTGRALTLDALPALPHGRVIHTGALRALAPDVPLDHRGLYLVHVALPPGTLGDADTWYTPDPALWFGRASQPARFSRALARGDVDVLAVEIPEGRWGRGVDFVARRRELVDQLREARVLPRGAEPVELRQTFVPGVYPLYLRGWVRAWRRALGAVRALGRVLPAGRQGLFLHCNMDHALGTAADAVAHLLRGGEAGAWLDGCERYLDLRVRD